MKRLNMVTLLGAALALNGLAVASAWACASAGENTHVGVVLQVNAADRQFSIRDAETGQSISFTAPAEWQPVSVGDRVAVTYEEHAGALTATRIQ